MRLSLTPDVRRAVRVDTSAALLVTLFTGLTLPFTGLVLRRDLGASPLQLAVLAAANAACLLLSFALARLIDTRRPLSYVVWPGFAARTLFLLVPLISSAWPFVGLLVAATLLTTLAAPAQAALVQRVYPVAQRGRALGMVRMTGALGAIALAAVAGQLIDQFTFRWVFCAAAVAGMAASLSLLRLPVPPAAADASPERVRLHEAWRTLREDAGYRRLLLASFVFGSGIWLQMPATPLLLADVVQATTTQVGFLAGAAGAAALFGNLFWGRLTDRRSSLEALRAVYLIGAITPLIYFVASSPSLLLLASVAESLMATGLDLVWMLAVIDFAGPRRTTQYAAIAGTLAGIRGVLAPLIGAAVIETLGIRAVYMAAAVLMAGGAWLVSRHVGAPQKTPRYMEHPRQTSGGVSVSSAALNVS